MRSSPLVSVAAMVTAATFASYALWKMYSPHAKRRRLRQKLPKDLKTWRTPPDDSPETEDKAWLDLDEVFREAGLAPWPIAIHELQLAKTPGHTYPLSSGFGYVAGHRTDLKGQGSANSLRQFQQSNLNIRIARTRDGQDVIIRVIVIRNEGYDHLKILRKVATGVNSLYSNNHALPMFSEFQFEDIIFGIFPKAGWDTWYLYGRWARNSAGDIVEIIMQMLEALAFIHKLNIAHRDAFRDNFVIQWQPESLKTMTISPSRPRVYLIDFEVAVEFASDCPVEERVVTGYPLGGTLTDLDIYQRPHAPEFATGKPYSPFKLDVWQIATSLSGVRSTVTDIDQVLDDMGNADADQRPDAQDALDRIRKVVHSIPPESLLIPPWIEKDWFAEFQAKLELQNSNNNVNSSQ
ncbi:hypothetical protein BJ912DRAFT_302905 [Pholiota molesta]|nr:hypothetical protein BJ912DRAFT_302905 [Pholiota molesta]